MPMLTDTHRSVNKLISKGIKKPQAEAIVELISGAGEELATKTDIQQLRTEIYRVNMATIGILSGVIIFVEFFTR